MKHGITTTCETCNKELKTHEQWRECFHADHNIRSKGFFIIPDKKVTFK